MPAQLTYCHPEQSDEAEPTLRTEEHPEAPWLLGRGTPLVPCTQEQATAQSATAYAYRRTHNPCVEEELQGGHQTERL